MRLVSVKYSEYYGGAQQWVLEEILLSNKNLIVGKNSTGKSRALFVLASLGRSLSAPQAVLLSSGDYRCKWESDDGKIYVYEYLIEGAQVLMERLTIDGKVYMDRGNEGEGVILFETVENGTMLRFQTPPSELAVMKRRDAVQHGFIEPIYQWAAAVRHYQFGTSLGREHLALFVAAGAAVDDRDPNQVVGIFKEGMKHFGDAFRDSIVEDINEVGFDVADVGISFPVSVVAQNLPPDITALYIKEKGLPGIVDQITMSQGMYRVLALLIHVNYLQFKRTSTCVVIDDVGEGLDFERSCGLISVLRRKADETGIQVIMSTNDQFVMNEVPLKEWTVLHRHGSTVKVSNYSNSPERFDQFRFTGLSNFSFFEMDYLESSSEDL